MANEILKSLTAGTIDELLQSEVNKNLKVKKSASRTHLHNIKTELKPEDQEKIIKEILKNKDLGEIAKKNFSNDRRKRNARKP